MFKSLLLVPLFACFFAGCAHLTSMNDPDLKGLYQAGQPQGAQAIQKAEAKWPNDATLLEMQEAFALLRNGSSTEETQSRAKQYLEKAVSSFEDLKTPDNFSKAFTADAATPYRGRPYERVLASLFLGILDVVDGRCDMALPSFKSAEFLDARWQPFQFGTDAPLVYALTLRCLIQNKSSDGDIQRAKEGLFRSIRMLEALEPARQAFFGNQRNLTDQDATHQAAFLVLEAGLSSALMEAEPSAKSDDILHRVVSDSLRYYVQVLSNKDDSLFDTLEVVAKKVEQEVGSKEKYPSAQALARIEATLNELVAQANTSSRLKKVIENKIDTALKSTHAIVEAVSKPKSILSFKGFGPKVVSEGTHKEIAKIVPGNAENAKAGTPHATFEVSEQCGLNQRANQGLDVVLCDERARHADKAEPRTWNGIKLWSSSYQATSMVGRRFDKILKGRADFRSGSEVAAVIGAYTAIALLEAGGSMRRQCQATGRGCDAARNMELAGAIAGVIAGGAFLAGRAVSPEADTRHLTDAFESGYLMLKARE